MHASFSRASRRLALLTTILFATLLSGLASYRYGTGLLSPPRVGTSASPALALSVFDPPRPVPPIRFTDGLGHDHTLHDFRARVVLLDIWATWCGPCRNEMPSLERLDAKLDGADFSVLPVSIDRTGLAAVAPFYRAIGIARLGVYLDPLGRGTSALAIPGVPTAFLIDRGGEMVARKVGGADWDSPDMIALVRRYLPAVAAAPAGR
jgi:thiol-disulfide isomerase/thioredoxin